MKKSTLALLLNFTCFGAIFLLFKTLIGTYLPMGYLPLIAFSALLTGVFTPKFMVHKQALFVKLPLRKKPIEL